MIRFRDIFQNLHEYCKCIYAFVSTAFRFCAKLFLVFTLLQLSASFQQQSADTIIINTYIYTTAHKPMHSNKKKQYSN